MIIDDGEIQRKEIQRLRAWLETLANMRRIVGFVDENLVEVLARRALSGEAVPVNMRKAS